MHPLTQGSWQVYMDWLAHPLHGDGKQKSEGHTESEPQTRGVQHMRPVELPQGSPPYSSFSQWKPVRDLLDPFLALKRTYRVA